MIITKFKSCPEMCVNEHGTTFVKLLTCCKRIIDISEKMSSSEELREKFAGGQDWSRWKWNPLFIIIIIIVIIVVIITIIIIITRPKPAYGRQGLAGRSLCASGAQLGKGQWSFSLPDTHTNTASWYIYHHHHNVHLFALDHVLGGSSEVAQACVAKLPVTCAVISYFGIKS